MNYFTAGSNVSPSQRFDPNAGINLAATTAANLSNYNANIYSADQTRAAAEAAAAATKSASKTSLFGSLLGAIPGIGGLAKDLFGKKG
jgi:CelD/BcsL family acetyltransferase involved in cellulose biosynthesis